MARAPLIASGGALLAPDLIPKEWFAALRAEGLAFRAAAREQHKLEADSGGWRSGNPARYLASALGGTVQGAIYRDPGVSVELGRLAGHPVAPTGDQGSYSYYDQPGHFLGLHRDVRRCDLTLLICLHRVEGAIPSGSLRLYPKAMTTDLTDIGPGTPFLDVEMTPGSAVLLLGGCIPHEVRPAAPGFARAVSVLCYEIQP